MNNSAKGAIRKILVILIILLVSAIAIYTMLNSSITDGSMDRNEVILSFALLLFILIAPAFKRRERTTFLSRNNQFFSI